MEVYWILNSLIKLDSVCGYNPVWGSTILEKTDRVVKSGPFQWTPWDLISEKMCGVVNGERQISDLPLYCSIFFCDIYIAIY